MNGWISHGTGRPLLAIAGPTAAGKSALALQIAQQHRLDLVCCDSVQIYRYLDIGSAKPSQADRQLVAHHMLDLIDPDDSFSAGDYARLALPIVQSRPVVVCGGTGLYLRALAYSHSGDDGRGDVARVDPARAEFEASWQVREAETPGSAHRALLQVDPVTAAQVHPNNLVRCIRSLWLCHWHGEAVSGLRQRDPPRPRFNLLVVVIDPGQELLAAWIAQRCYRMIASGWVEEVEMLRRAGYDAAHKACTSLGYRQLFEHVEGRCTLDEATKAIIAATCQYARRQRTYLRHQLPGATLLPVRQPSEVPMERIGEFLQSSQGEPA